MSLNMGKIPFHLVEKGIRPLVEVVNQIGLETFSSCEGHIEDEIESFPRLPLVGFYASEAEALQVHKKFLLYRNQLSCSWVFRAGFVLRRVVNEWNLGWTLENTGIIVNGEQGRFVEETVTASRNVDIPLLIDMFKSVSIK